MEAVRLAWVRGHGVQRWLLQGLRDDVSCLTALVLVRVPLCNVCVDCGHELLLVDPFQEGLCDLVQVGRVWWSAPVSGAVVAGAVAARPSFGLNVLCWGHFLRVEGLLDAAC